MLSKEDNELITRTGPGAPMGKVFREYWLPAMLSRELPRPDCDPIRIMLLGEKLIAFRDAVGPFGTLLMTGLDWSGPNAQWERESMRLLAQEVMPKFRQHVTARAAE